MIHLRELHFKHNGKDSTKFPWNVPALQTMTLLSFQAPVTILVGENGSGKSTLLEALARSVGSIAIGSDDIGRDKTLDAVQPLADALKLVWNKRTHRGFFLRAEDFFGYINRLRSMREFMVDELDRIDEEYQDRSDYARKLASGPAASSLKSLDRKYGENLDANSHGESFLALFQSRFVPGGLYLLDEPEAALSPLRQLGLISMIKAMVEKDAQFLIATHSPILMAVPGAAIYDFDQNPPCLTAYDQLDHVSLYRTFLEDPDAFVHRL